MHACGIYIINAQVTNEEELKEAIDVTMGRSKKECLCFLEVILHRDDTSKELLQFGPRVALANSRPPNTNNGL